MTGPWFFTGNGSDQKPALSTIEHLCYSLLAEHRSRPIIVKVMDPDQEPGPESGHVLYYVNSVVDLFFFH